MAPLSAALANGDDAEHTADWYSTADTALLAYYTSSQVDTLLGDYQTRPAPSRPRCWPTTLPHKWTPCWKTAARRARRTRRRKPPSTNQITSALVAYSSAADQEIAAALLSYYTITQVDGLVGKFGVTEGSRSLSS